VTALETYHWMLRICAIGIVIDALEQLVHRRDFRDDGWFSWRILRRRLDLAPRIVRALCDAVCAGEHRPVLVLCLRLGAVATVAAFAPGSTAFAIGLTALLATQLHLFLRRAGLGIDGSDQMNLVILGASWLAIVVDGTVDGLRVGLWFVVAQSMLSYGVNGASKLASASWRSGRAIPAAFSTSSSGHPALHRVFVARPRLARLMAWGTWAWELGFPVVLVVPEPIRIPLLISGVVFHLTIAVTMGIHLFVWAFVAPYVAIWAVTQ
jgi:hypothetical protein